MQLWALSNSSRFRYIQIETLESGSNKILRLSSSELRVLTSQNSETYDVASRAWRSLHSHVECCGSFNPAWILLIRGDLELRTFLVPFTGFFELKSCCRLGRFLEKENFVPRTGLPNSCVLFVKWHSERGRKHGFIFPKGDRLFDSRSSWRARCNMSDDASQLSCTLLYSNLCYVGHIMTHHDASLLCD